MRTNIIHVLIIAIILIAGWSLFTILQDIYNTDATKYRSYSVVGKSKQYLPLIPQNYSGQRKYPVYKPSSSTLSQSRYSRVNGHVSLPQINEEELFVNEMNYNVQLRSESDQLSQNAKKVSQNSSRNIAETSMSRMVKPFSRSMAVDTRRNIADASVSIEGTSGSMSEGSGMMRIFGNEEEGDAIEGGGGTDNYKFYNDVPVGDGLYLLVLMAVFYGLFKALKMSNKFSYKNNR
ncbi:MAG: hypothetical protein VB102_01110 [Paludibacter sp.]|nr:hypothetical protein [Paludibacter sp.]